MLNCKRGLSLDLHFVYRYQRTVRGRTICKLSAEMSADDCALFGAGLSHDFPIVRRISQEGAQRNKDGM